MGKRALIVLIGLALALVIFALVVGAFRPDDELELGTDNGSNVVKTWRVTKSTGLYDGIDPDSNMIKSLSVGTRVRSTRSSGNLTCLVNDEGMELCRVEVVGDGDEGWILRKWID